MASVDHDSSFTPLQPFDDDVGLATGTGCLVLLIVLSQLNPVIAPYLDRCELFSRLQSHVLGMASIRQLAQDFVNRFQIAHPHAGLYSAASWRSVIGRPRLRHGTIRSTEYAPHVEQSAIGHDK